LPLSVYKDIIEKGVKHGLCAICPSNNFEPLVEKRFVDYIKVAKDAGVIDIMMHTNGHLLNREKSVELIKSGLTWMNFSIGAVTKKTYASMREGANFELVIKNVLDFIDIKKELHTRLPIVRVSFVNTRQNTHELDDFVNFWENRADVVVIQNLVNTYQRSKDFESFKDEFHIKYKEKEKTKRLCFHPFQTLRISNNGDITPCCNFFGYDMVLGNVYKDDVYDIWNGEIMNDLRKTINTEKRPDLCKKCLDAMDW
jgi:radical SAM protein with 4Fe4S-binding SPASM domain